VVGYEALTRFDVPRTPAQVFAEAAALGRTLDLEAATMRAALAAAQDLPRQCWLSLNVSPALLADQLTMHQLLKDVRRAVVLEISEHDAITDYEPIAACLRSLGRTRVVAVDDAGAGFASLRHILEVRPAYVKLDLGLVQQVSGDLTRRALVAGMVRFATDAGFKLIAEGIETEDDLAALRDLGLRLGQGYLLGRPALASEIVASRRRAALRAV
jgi:EAL domain-containing protein (putative c-di-GMP-specific phosphodiesterase class I)